MARGGRAGAGTVKSRILRKILVEVNLGGVAGSSEYTKGNFMKGDPPAGYYKGDFLKAGPSRPIDPESPVMTIGGRVPVGTPGRPSLPKGRSAKGRKGTSARRVASKSKGGRASGGKTRSGTRRRPK